MTTPAGAISMNQATAVLLSDGWHAITAGSLGVVIDPSFSDPTSGHAVVPGEPWAQFTDSAGQTFACPVRGLLAVKLSAPITGNAQ